MRKLVLALSATALLGSAVPAFAASAQHATNTAPHIAALDRDQQSIALRRAALAGDPQAQWRLGVMIDQGEAPGSLQDAVELFRQAAGQKNADAMTSLAVMYANGRGVEQDFVSAMRYYQAAARFGNAHALQGLGVLYANGQGVEQDMDEALAYWLVAAAAGDGSALTLLEHYLPTDRAELARIYERASRTADAYGILAQYGQASAR